VTDVTVREIASRDLLPEQVVELRALFAAAWSNKDGEFSEDDWRSASGGIHVVVDGGGRILSHASVVTRVLESGDRPLRTGYVEAVATSPQHQGRGYATKVMTAVGDVLGRYELGALDTAIPAFYERFGWERWQGPTAVRTERGVITTPEEDGQVMILRTASSPTDLDLAAPISCDWRPGDVW
jgi:aminoglycoside 2'-N-acetyltransferase I